MAPVLVSADDIARPFRESVRAQVQALGAPIKLRGILASEPRGPEARPDPREVYAQYAASACHDVGISFELRAVPRLEVEDAIGSANEDPQVHGVIVYYPVFGGERDRTLQDEVALEKDVEGLSAHWVYSLYHDVRTVGVDDSRKAVLPCTPLAIVKAFEHLGVYAKDLARGTQARGKTVAVFNRSEVVGRPLAAMLAHDGARVFSFDVDGCLEYEAKDVRESRATRAAALAAADAVVTGVPSRDFPLVQASEIKPGAVCVNFSTVKNMADDVIARASAFLPRVGPITVAMLLRNTLRLYENFHRSPGA
jgi:methylenetetrahydrofolate dehydrogenase (NADP+)/methenyltetrahydrofolate cyclohydrolase